MEKPCWKWIILKGKFQKYYKDNSNAFTRNRIASTQRAMYFNSQLRMPIRSCSCESEQCSARSLLALSLSHHLCIWFSRSRSPARAPSLSHSFFLVLFLSLPLSYFPSLSLLFSLMQIQSYFLCDICAIRTSSTQHIDYTFLDSSTRKFAHTTCSATISLGEFTARWNYSCIVGIAWSACTLCRRWNATQGKWTI